MRTFKQLSTEEQSMVRLLSRILAQSEFMGDDSPGFTLEDISSKFSVRKSGVAAVKANQTRQYMYGPN